MTPPSSGYVAAGMGALALVVASTAVSALLRSQEARTWKARAPWWLAAGAWLALPAVLAMRGVLESWDARPPPMVVLMVGVLGATIALCASGPGRRLSSGPALASLVLFQSFRLPLEILMHRAAREGLMPVQMSFSGYNLDIITGATALVLGLLHTRKPLPRGVLWGWNVLGTLLLLNIMAIAIVSTPMVAAFGPLRLNTWVAYFPYVWLPTVLVPAALAGHLLLFRRLAQERRSPLA